MAEVTVLASTGNSMVAEAFRQAEPDVVAAYPITPQTAIVEQFDKYVADGRVHTEFVPVESEHSSMSACIGASASGARVATATASQGLALMYEELHIASGMRLPIVMANANRAISAPINIHGDHSDIMGARDTGWIIFFAETAQEAYDNTLISFRVAETPEVSLPVITSMDGFITSHAMERCELLDDATVAAYVGKRTAEYPLIGGDMPIGHGMFASLGDGYLKIKKAQRAAIDGAAPYIKQMGDEWAKVCGRPFDFVDTYECDDADFIIVVLGSAAGNARTVAKELREQGVKAGVLRIRLYRPFPAEDVRKALAGSKAVAILDRSDSFGSIYGPVGMDVRTALYDLPQRIPTRDYIYGLGGANITLDMMREVYNDLQDLAAGKADEGLSYLGVR
jgi:pyruvate ferredoxin oxidoreductase alpha subunit